MSFVKCCFEAGEGHDFLDSFIQKCTDPGCKSISFLFVFYYVSLALCIMDVIKLCMLPSHT